MQKPDELMNRAMEVFAKGFADTRCYTHPCLAKRVGKLWQVKDGPREKGDYRREEWIGCGLPPERYQQAAQKHSITKHVVSAISNVGESDEDLRDGFKALNYRLGGTEALMVHEMKRIPRAEKPVNIVRVLQQDLADRLNKAAGPRQILPEHLVKDAPVRQYVALANDEPIGWVRSHDVEGASWCANMYVKKEFRRRGIARAMMCEMLRDDRKYGSKLAVLTASHAGSHLYPLVGYREIGTLLICTPKKRPSG
jgi:GNAT superfamily N-acetyltransferase